MRKKVRIYTLLLLNLTLTAVVVLSLACSSSDEPTAKGETPQYGGTLNIAISMDMKTLDEVYDSTSGGDDVANMIAGRLVDLNRDNEVIPSMAQSWDISTNGKAITFHLVNGATFHDGTQFNAKAVKAHVDRVLDPIVASRYAAELSNVDSVTVDDEYTVTINMKAPDRTLLSTLTTQPGFINSPTAVAKYNSYADPLGDYGKHPTTAGPFKLTEWVPDDHITLERYEEFWIPGRPYLDKIRVIHVPDVSTRRAMVRTGDADLYARAAAADVKIVEDHPDVVIDTMHQGNINFIGISQDVEPYNNKTLRQALAYAIDRETLVDVFFLGAATPAYSPIPAGWAYNPDIKIFDYDPDKAKAKLIEAGYPNGIDLVFSTASSVNNLLLAEIYQAQLKEIGVNVTINEVPSSEYWSGVIGREHHMVARWRSNKGDPGVLTNQTFLKGGSGNVMGYDNPRVNDLLTRARGMYDTAQAKKLYDEAQTLITDDVFGVWTVYTKQFAILNKRVHGYQLIPDLYTRTTDIWVSK